MWGSMWGVGYHTLNNLFAAPPTLVLPSFISYPWSCRTPLPPDLSPRGYGAQGGAHRSADKADRYMKMTDAAGKYSDYTHSLSTPRMRYKDVSVSSQNVDATTFHINTEAVKEFFQVVTEAAPAGSSYLGRSLLHFAVGGAFADRPALNCLTSEGAYVPERRDLLLEARHKRDRELGRVASSGRFTAATSVPFWCFSYQTDSDGDAVAVLLEHATTMELLPEVYHNLITIVGNDAETYNRDRRILYWLSMLRRACVLAIAVRDAKQAQDTAAVQRLSALRELHDTEINQSYSKVEALMTTPEERYALLSKIGSCPEDPLMVEERFRLTLACYYDPVYEYDYNVKGLKFDSILLTSMNKSGTTGLKATLASFGITPTGQSKALILSGVRKFVLAFQRVQRGRDLTQEEAELEALHAHGFTETDVLNKDPSTLPRLSSTFLMLEPWHLVFALIGNLTVGSKTDKTKPASESAAKQLVWYALQRPFLEAKFQNSKFKETMTDHVKQSMAMDFGDMYLYVGLRREAFLALRTELATKYPLEQANPDVELLWSIFDHLDMVVLNFIPSLKHGSEHVLMEHFAEIGRACNMLGNSTYLAISIKLINDLLGLKQRYPRAYTEIIASFCSTVTVYIEQQHALLTAVAPTHSRADVSATNQRLRQLEMHRAAYGFLLGYRVRESSGYRVPNAQGAARDLDRATWRKVILEAFHLAATGSSYIPLENDKYVVNSAFKCAGESIKYESKVLLRIGGSAAAIDAAIEAAHRNNEALLRYPAKEPEDTTHDEGKGGESKTGSLDGDDSSSDEDAWPEEYEQNYLLHGRRSPRKFIKMFSQYGRRNPRDKGGLDYNKMEAAVEEIVGPGTCWSKAQRAAEAT